MVFSEEKKPVKKSYRFPQHLKKVSLKIFGRPNHQKCLCVNVFKIFPLFLFPHVFSYFYLDNFLGLFPQISNSQIHAYAQLSFTFSSPRLHRKRVAISKKGMLESIKQRLGRTTGEAYAFAPILMIPSNYSATIINSKKTR